MNNVKDPDKIAERNIIFERIVDQYQLSLLKMCYLHLRDQSLAEDAVQETLLKVYRSLDSFQGQCSEKTWIMKIAINTCRDMNRSSWYRFVSYEVTPDMLPEPSTELEEHDEVLTLAVMNLPRKLREVILLYYYQDISTIEISDLLGISHSSVSGQLKRAKDKLRKSIERSEFYEQKNT